MNTILGKSILGKRLAVARVSVCVLSLAGLLAISGAPGSAQQRVSLLRDIDESLFFEAEDGFWRVDMGGHLSLEGYTIDQLPPGLLFSDDDFLFHPRGALMFDAAVGDHLYSFTKIGIDRGFDPGLTPGGDIRADEVFLRYSPFDDGQVHLQAGKFATFFGNYVPRHEVTLSPFITAPMAYENVVTVGDGAGPGGVDAFLARRDRALGDNKPGWMPVIWGPSYSAGAAAFGRLKRVDYAIEFKNASLSSRSAEWKIHERNWSDPTVTGRIGVRPNAAWNIGASASYGGYMKQNAAIPGGADPEDFKQLTVGSDIGFAWRHWQVWAEAIAARFEVPNVGDVETITYYLETKYKVTPRLYTALRWNQQFFDTLRNTAGQEVRWDRNAWKAETALGYKFSSHILGKLQYSYGKQEGHLQQGEQLVAGQLVFRF